MPVGLSKRPETAIREATENSERCNWRSVRYHREHVEDGELFVEAGVTEGGGTETVVNYADALSRAMLDIADGRTCHGALVVGKTLSRWTIDESHSDLTDEELRQRVTHALRVD